jgi:hypothetical protein
LTVYGSPPPARRKEKFQRMIKLNMRTAIIFALILSTATVHGQQVNSKDLVGKWVIVNSDNEAGGEINFLDGRSVSVVTEIFTNTHCVYTIDNTNFDLTDIMVGTNANNNFRSVARLLLKKINDDRFKVQVSLSDQHIDDWQLPETRDNTGFMVRKK